MPAKTSNIFSEFAKNAAQNQSKDALLFSQSVAYRSETYGSILLKSIEFSRALKARGVSSGDRVIIMLENCPEFSWAVMGVFACGGVIVPLDTQYASDSILNVLKHSGAEVIVSSKKFYQLHARDIHADWVCLDKIVMDVKDDDLREDHIPRVIKDENEIAALFYTSGTTSTPKGVVLTHANLLANVNSICSAQLVTPQDVVISILPLHHTYAFTVTLLCPLLIGMTVVYPKSLASGDLLACIKQTCTTHFVGVPQIFAMIHRSIKDQISQMPPILRTAISAAETVGMGSRKWAGINASSKIFKKIHQRFGSSLKTMVSGGARLDPVIAEDFYRWGFTLVEGYGLTETAPVVSFSVPDNPKFGSVGKPLPGVEIRIDKPDENGVGEVCIKGANVMQGYYQMPEETAKILKGGWFHSGDVGYIDKEGFLFLTGRRKEMLVLSNGKNIHPEELEHFYGQNPFIKEVAVLLVRDEKKSVDLTQLVAIVVPNEDYFLEQQEMHILKRMRWELENYSAKLPTYKRVRGFVISQEDLPRTRLGKLKRFTLEDMYFKLRSGKVKEKISKPKVVASQFITSALKFIGDQIGRQIGPEDHLELDLCLDSLGRVELFVALQKHLRITLSDEELQDFYSCSTVGQIMDKLKVVEEHVKGQRALAEAATKGFSAMAKSALTYLEEQAGRDVSLDDHLELDLGMDSLSRIELLLGIQERLGLSLSEEDSLRFFMCAKVGDLLDELNRVTVDTQTYRKALVDWREVLFQQPDESGVRQVNLEPLNFMEKVVNFFMIGLLRVFFKIFFQLKVEGTENLPHEGPYIVCANHNTYFDGLFITATMPFDVATQTFFLGDSKFLDYWMLRPFKKLARLIAIQFTHRMVDAMQLCSYVLRQDKILCYFPEGQRSIDGEVKEFRKGIGVLIHELDVPVVPVYIQGAFDVWPRGQRWPKPGKVSVHFGTPISARDLEFKMTESEDVYQRVSTNLREKVISLSSQG